MRFSELQRKVTEQAFGPTKGAGRNWLKATFWAVCSSVGSEPAEPAKALLSAVESGNCAARVVALGCLPNGSAVVEGCCSEAPASAATEDIVRWMSASSDRHFVFVDRFENWKLDRQIEFLSTMRGQREDANNLVLVVAGRWRYQALCEEWRQRSNAGVLGSHPFDVNWELEGYDLAEIAIIVDGWPSIHGPDDKSLLAEFVVRVTLGDTDVIRILDVIVQYQNGISPHQLVADLSANVAMEKLAQERTRELSTRAEIILESALRFQCVRLDSSDLDAEELFLRGLLRRVGGGTVGASVWEVSSPVLAGVLLDRWSRKGSERFRHGSELFLPAHPAATRAFEEISHVENLLRNALTLSLGWDCESKLASALIARLPSDDRDATWRREYGDATDGSPLLRRPMSGYLDLESLKGLICGDELYARVFKEQFPDKAALMTYFERLGRVRRHVAHNRAVGPQVLEELAAIRKWFDHSLSVAARRNIERLQTASVNLSLRATKVIPIKKDDKAKIIAEVTNESGLHLKMAQVSLTGFENDRRAVCERPLTLRPGETQEAHFILKGPEPQFDLGHLLVVAEPWVS